MHSATSLLKLNVTSIVFGGFFAVSRSATAHFVVHVADGLERILGVLFLFNLETRVRFEHLIEVLVQNGESGLVGHVDVEFLADALLSLGLNLEHLGAFGLSKRKWPLVKMLDLGTKADTALNLQSFVAWLSS